MEVLETLPSHFPDLPELVSKLPKRVGSDSPVHDGTMMEEDGLDEPGSFERFYLSGIFWLHERANASSYARA